MPKNHSGTLAPIPDPGTEEEAARPNRRISTPSPCRTRRTFTAFGSPDASRHLAVQRRELAAVAIRRSCRVPVLAPDGQPLTPARPERVRYLLDTKRARVRWLIGRVFAIQLLSEPSGREIVPLSLGIDDGAKHVGLSVVMPRKRRPTQEVVSVAVQLPQGIKERMDRRRNHRRSRRYRLGYRKERFLNRPTGVCQICGRNARGGKDACREHGDRNLRDEREKRVPNFAPWLPPSQRARKDGILRTVKTLLKILPVSTVTVEAGEFDFGLLGRPWEYKYVHPLGPRYRQACTLAALVAAYGAKCCYCGQEARTGDPLTVDHWQPRARGGTDRWGNLVAAHLSCNQAKRDRTPREAGLNPIYEPREIGDTELVKWASRTQQGKRYLARKLVDLGLVYKHTYGYYTALLRKEIGEEKSHRADARVIATSAYPAYWVPSRRWRRRLGSAKGPSPVARGIEYRAVLRAVGGHALHGGTCYRVRARLDNRVVLSVRAPDGIRVKKVQAAQVAMVQAGAVLRAEVNWAVVVTGTAVQVVRVGEPVPRGDVVIHKGQLAEARVGCRRVRGVVTTLWSSGSVGIGTDEGTVRCSPRRVRVMAHRAGCLVYA